MKKEITAARMHELLKRNAFADVDLSQVETMGADELRAFTVGQADRLLGILPYGEMMGWFMDKFFDGEFERREDNPLRLEDSALVRWYYELADLGWCLLTHLPFDLNTIEPGLGTAAPDSEQDNATPFSNPELAYGIDNERLVCWLRSTPYKRVAALVSRIMLEREYDRVVGHFDAVQDYYAEHCRSDLLDLQKTDQCEAFVASVLDAIQTVLDHQQKGRALGLDDDGLEVVDALWGWMPHDYDADCVAATREICEAVEASMPAPTVIRSRNGFARFQKPVMQQMEAIARRHDLDVDLTDKYNITMGYLTDWLYRKYMGREIDNNGEWNGDEEF